MDSDEEEDCVVQEFDVFLSKTLAKNLFVFQYPVRPAHLNYDDMTVLDAQVKPLQQKVELQLALNTRSSTYDRSKGQQIALNVDGHREEDCYFNSDVMDKQILTSSQAVTSPSQYAVGIFKNDELHLTQVQGIVQLRPSFNYLDRSDAKQKQENKDMGEEDSSQDEAEEEAKAVTVKFARPESDRLKKARETSYHYLQQKKSEEPWMKVDFFHYQSESSRQETKLLECAHPDEVIRELHISPNEYLHMLIPEELTTDISKPAASTAMMSMAHLRQLPLNDQIKTLMLNVKIIQFCQLLSLLSSNVDSLCILRGLQQVAMLVQGCWVVKSDLLYPKDTISPHSGVSAEILCRGRDYVMWRFTQNRHIIRKEVSAEVKLPPEDLKEILEQMAKQRRKEGWEFLLPFDADFIHRYPEVVERQKMLWEIRYNQLAKTIKVTKVNSPEKGVPENKTIPSPGKVRQRRRTKSLKESENILGEVDSVKKNLEAFAYREQVTTIKTEPLPVRIKTEPIDEPSYSDNRLLSGGNDGDQNPSGLLKIKSEPVDFLDLSYDFGELDGTQQIDMPDPVNLLRELTSFVHERLITRWCMTLSELKRALTLKLAESPPGHILSRGVSDGLIEKAAVAAGASHLQTQWPNGSHQEPLFALKSVGDHRDPWRQALLDMFRTNSRYRKMALKKKIDETIGYTLSESEFVQLLQEYCVGNKSGMYYLKGTMPPASGH